MFELMQLSGSASGAGFARFLPGSFAADVRFPKGPGFALPGTGFVDFALAGFGVKKDAVIAFGEFDKAAADADIADVFFLAGGGRDF